ncbi:Dynein heavy chain 12, axonemal [Liparis tanakae]|uniref:Dynein heavy chain 12, axonemal n=1 Tax=Liparis tanakae TaxID=230148 RepID=A0A4Z2FHP9_9TELE|nr:Dynein heavy chain 12, axonemal [Liparis tanakae]
MGLSLCQVPATRRAYPAATAPTGTASCPSLPPVRASGYRLESLEEEERRRRAAAERAAQWRAEEEEEEEAPEAAARRAAGRTVAALGKASRVEAARAEKARGRADWVEAAGAKRAGRELLRRQAARTGPALFARRETTRQRRARLELAREQVFQTHAARFQANTGTAAEERTARFEAARAEAHREDYARWEEDNYMIRKGFIERRHYDAMPERWLDAIVARVPPGLKDGPENQNSLQELIQECRQHYHHTIVQHAVDTTIKDPRTGEGGEEPAFAPPRTLDFSESRRRSFVRSRKLMEQNLHVLHPVMQRVSAVGIATLPPLIFQVDHSTASTPAACQSIRDNIAAQCQRSEDRIMSTWFHKVVELLTSSGALKGVPEGDVGSFYNCASTLISNQLKSLLQRSVEEFVNLFDPNNRHRSPVFALALTLDDEKMEMYPDLEACVLEILDVIANTLQSGAVTLLVDTKVPDHVLARARVTVKTAVFQNLEQPDQHLRSYVDNYDWLLNGTAQARVEKLIEEEHSFDEYTEVRTTVKLKPHSSRTGVPKLLSREGYITCPFSDGGGSLMEEFQVLVKQIGSLPVKVHFSMVQLDCEELNRGLADKAKSYSDVLLEKLIASHREQNTQICSELETIRENVLREPRSTAEMTHVIDCINDATGLAELNARIKESFQRFSFINQFHSLEPEDQELNATLFRWPQEIRHVFQLSDELMVKATLNGKQELLARRERLMVQLEALGRRTERYPLVSRVELMQKVQSVTGTHTYKYFGQIEVFTLLLRYVREVRTDWTLLHEVDEEIASINKEELFYKLAPTCYPEVEVIKASIQLHEKLFGFMLKWQRTQSRSVSS